MYKRPKISSIFFESMERLNIPVIAGVSEEESLSVATKYGAEIVITDNHPLGRKWNRTIQHAMSRIGNWTHLLIMGDDDILLPEFLPAIGKYPDEPLLGVSQMYITEPATKRAVRFEYKNGVAIGSGRVIRRDVLEKIGGELFDPTLEYGLDLSADHKLFQYGRHMPKIIDNNVRPMLTGLKSSTNIWPYEKFEIYESVPYFQALEGMGEKELKMINEL